MCVNKSTYAKKQHNCCYLFYFFSFFYFAAFSARDGDPGAIEAGRPCCRAEITLPHLCFFGQPCESNPTLLLSVKWFSLGHSLQKNTLAWKGKENKIAALYFKDSEEPFLNCYFFFHIGAEYVWTRNEQRPLTSQQPDGSLVEHAQNRVRTVRDWEHHTTQISFQLWKDEACVCLSVCLSVTHLLGCFISLHCCVSETKKPLVL